MSRAAVTAGIRVKLIGARSLRTRKRGAARLDAPAPRSYLPPSMNPLRRLSARRYVQPLREGGSLPAVVETEDGLFVAKFRGSGQGPRALIAELVVGVIARALGLPVPEPAVIELPAGIGEDEGDPEIRELLDRSRGVNMGLRYLDGAFNFDAHAAGDLIAADLAADVVWLDAFLTNPDRTARNPNLMICERSPWLIDHGSALYAHHDWPGVNGARTRTPFPLIREHVLLLLAGDIGAADARLAPRLSGDVLGAALEQVPDALLMDPLARDGFDSGDDARARYVGYLRERLREPREFVAEAERAKASKRDEPPRRLGVRR